MIRKNSIIRYDSDLSQFISKPYELKREWRPSRQPLDYGQPRSPLFIRWSGNTAWKPGARFARQASPIFGIELVTAGEIAFTQGGVNHIVKPGQVFLKHKGLSHAYEVGPSGYAHKRYICIDGPALDIVLLSAGLRDHHVITLSEPCALAAILKRINQLFATKPRGYLTELSVKAYAVIAELSRQIANAGLPLPLSQALEYIGAHANRPITLTEIAAAALSSTSTISHLFREYLHASPIDYSNTIRLDIAKRLLKDEPSISIKKVSSTLGWKDPYYFSAQFKKATGMSPLAFRNSGI